MFHSFEQKGTFSAAKNVFPEQNTSADASKQSKSVFVCCKNAKAKHSPHGYFLVNLMFKMF